MNASASPAAFITTSWDDGHPLDLRLAELLFDHGLPATFYIPRRSQRETLSAEQIRELSMRFEIGAHTMNHVYLDSCAPETARQEIFDSKKWVEDVTGKACTMFCPPAGKFSRLHLKMIEEAGFAGARTVELFSTALPRPRGQLRVMPTSIQAHSHGTGAYLRNIARRRALTNLWLYIRFGASEDWTAAARHLVDYCFRRGGVFHLWGHSWEIDHHEQWQRLESVFRYLNQLSAQMPSLTNGPLCSDTTSS